MKTYAADHDEQTLADGESFTLSVPTDGKHVDEVVVIVTDGSGGTIQHDLTATSTIQGVPYTDVTIKKVSGQSTRKEEFTAVPETMDVAVANASGGSATIRAVALSIGSVS